MDIKDAPTVEESLESLTGAIGKASEDLCAARATIEQARVDIASRNTSVTREVIRDAERVIDHLRQTDECLRDVVKDLSER